MVNQFQVVIYRTLLSCSYPMLQTLPDHCDMIILSNVTNTFFGPPWHDPCIEYYKHLFRTTVIYLLYRILQTLLSYHRDMLLVSNVTNLIRLGPIDPVWHIHWEYFQCSCLQPETLKRWYQSWLVDPSRYPPSQSSWYSYTFLHACRDKPLDQNVVLSGAQTL